MIINDNKEFEERADFINKDDLSNWTAENEHFENIQRKIIEKGAKLIVGPRGTGKTHQFRMAYYSCLFENKAPIAIYVSFGKYYRLEPLLFNSSNAIAIFHTWVLSKIIYSCYKALGLLEIEDDELIYSNVLSKDKLKSFIELAERYDSIPEYDDLIKFLSIQKTIDILNHLKELAKRKRIIVLLDDAALTLTPDYMIEFFDIFRSLKTTTISPKASVYPGTTQYGPRFHIGQDAEEVSIWLSVDNSSYSNFMDTLLKKRFADDNIDIPNEIVEILKFAAFGIPRAFISLLRDYNNDTGTTIQQKFNNIINNRKNLLTNEYKSFILKLPQYSSIINIGYELFETIIKEITKANKDDIQEKQINIGLLIENGQFYREDRMIRFLIEAGLLYKTSELHDGPDRIFNRYIPHFLFLIQNRAFSNSKGFNAKDILSNIKKKTNKRPLRRQFSTLLLPEQISRVKLDLPVCKKCGTARLTDEQKFCHHCGNPLIGQSAFELCLKIKIDELPITKWQKEKIKNETSFNSIEDIFISQSPVSELKKAKGIGDKKSGDIMKVVNEILDEFLS